jgi:hypothetical protein
MEKLVPMGQGEMLDVLRANIEIFFAATRVQYRSLTFCVINILCLAFSTVCCCFPILKNFGPQQHQRFVHEQTCGESCKHACG